MQALAVSVSVQSPPVDEGNPTKVIDLVDNRLVLTPPPNSGRESRTFRFHHHFISNAGEPLDVEKVNTELSSLLVGKVMQGYNAALWTYNAGRGNANMFGPESLSSAVFDALFQEITNRFKAMTTADVSTFRVELSMIEVLGNNLRDLVDNGKPLNANALKTVEKPSPVPAEAARRAVLDSLQLQNEVMTALKRRSPPTAEDGSSQVLLTLTVKHWQRTNQPLEPSSVPRATPSSPKASSSSPKTLPATAANSSPRANFRERISTLSLFDVQFASYEDPTAEGLRALVKELFDAKISPNTARVDGPPPGVPPPVSPTTPAPPLDAKSRSSSRMDGPAAPPPSATGKRSGSVFGLGPTPNTGRNVATPSAGAKPGAKKSGKDAKPDAPPPAMMLFTPEPGSGFTATLLNSLLRYFLTGNNFSIMHMELTSLAQDYNALLSALQVATRFSGTSRAEAPTIDERIIAHEDFAKLTATNIVPWTEPIPEPSEKTEGAPTSGEDGTAAASGGGGSAPLPKTVNIEPPPWKTYKHPQQTRLSWKRPIALKNPTIKWVRPNTSMIQPTLNLCSQGDIVIIQSGTYTDSIILSLKGLLIKAEEGAKVTLRCTANTPAVIFRTPYARMENITIVQDGNAEAVLFEKGAGEIINCDISGVCGGINIQNMCDPLIMNCKVHSSRRGYGIMLNHSRALLDSNEIYGNFDSGIVLEKAAHPYVVGNIVHDGKGSGITVLESATGMLIDNDIYHNACVGVLIQHGGNPLVQGNKIHDGKGVGISVCDNGRGVVQENDIYGNTGHDIEISKMGHPSIERNKMHDGKGSGICIWNNGRGEIIDNEMWNYDVACITIRENGNPLIKSNRLRKNMDGPEGSSGILITDRGKGQIEDNTLVGWQLEQPDGGGPIMMKTGGKATMASNKVIDGTEGKHHDKKEVAEDSSPTSSANVAVGSWAVASRAKGKAASPQRRSIATTKAGGSAMRPTSTK